MALKKRCGNCSIEKYLSEFRTMKEKRSKIAKEYLCSMCKTCEKERALKNYYKNQEKNMIKSKKYKEENKDKINKTRRVYIKKLMENPYERLKRNMKSLISTKIRKYKTKHIADYLGTDIKLMSWIEYNMNENMNWENYGKYWQIDHSIPISLFNLSNEQESLDCFCWMNLMPMLAIENLKKSNDIVQERVLLQQNKLKSYIEQFPLLENEIKNYIERYKNYVTLFKKD